MKHGLKTFLMAALVAGAALPALAQEASPPKPGGMQQGRMDPARMHEMMARRQAELKTQLKLTPAQEPAWTSWAAAMAPPADMASRMSRESRMKMRQEMEALTTPQRIDRMNAIKAQRDADMARRNDATKAFYAQLSAEQQKVFDRHGMRMMGPGGAGEMKH